MEVIYGELEAEKLSNIVTHYYNSSIMQSNMRRISPSGLTLVSYWECLVTTDVPRNIRNWKVVEGGRELLRALHVRDGVECQITGLAMTVLHRRVKKELI